jgi:hypothetical protein
MRKPAVFMLCFLLSACSHGKRWGSGSGENGAWADAQLPADLTGWMFVQAGTCEQTSRLQSIPAIEGKARKKFTYPGTGNVAYGDLVQRYLSKAAAYDPGFRDRYAGPARDLVSDIEGKFKKAKLDTQLLRDDFRWVNDDESLAEKCTHRTVLLVGLGREEGFIDPAAFARLDSMGKAAVVLQILLLAHSRTREIDAPHDEWRTRQAVAALTSSQYSRKLHDTYVRE